LTDLFMFLLLISNSTQPRPADCDCEFIPAWHREVGSEIARWTDESGFTGLSHPALQPSLIEYQLSLHN